MFKTKSATKLMFLTKESNLYAEILNPRYNLFPDWWRGLNKQDILKYCVKVGGALTGEHGVGIEKRELMCEAFNDKDIQQQLTIKIALDPNSLLNPGKVYPILRKCAEEGRVHVHGGKTKFPDIPRF